MRITTLHLMSIIISVSIFQNASDLAAQQLDVQGNALIKGNLNISYFGDSTSLHIGREAGLDANFLVGRENTYTGYQAGKFNVFGFSNSMFGSGAGRDNMGSHNSFFGRASGVFNIAGSDNSMFGFQTGVANNGNNNTFVGSNAGRGNNTGFENVYLGYFAGFGGSNFCSGDNNIAIGTQTQYSNISGFQNVAVGYQSLYQNETNYNSALGTQTLYNTKIGQNNSALGGFAGYSNDNANSTFIGYGAGSTVGVTNGTALGYDAKVNDNNKVRIGNGSVTVIEGNVAFSPMSDRRLKENIQTVDLGLAFIEDLRPVVYHRIGNEKPGLEMGLIAQELDSILIKHQASDVAMVNKGADGYFSVRYNDLIASLIKAIQEQQELINQLILTNNLQDQKIQSLIGIQDDTKKKLKNGKKHSEMASAFDH